MAKTIFSERRIEVYVRGGQSPRSIAYVTGHEMGHAVDYAYGTTARRKRWTDARSFDPGKDWFGCSGCDDLSTPAGDFAESFAASLLGPDGFRGRLGPSPTPGQRALMAELAMP